MVGRKAVEPVLVGTRINPVHSGELMAMTRSALARIASLAVNTIAFVSAGECATSAYFEHLLATEVWLEC
jgi:hypothetical protein